MLPLNLRRFNHALFICQAQFVFCRQSSEEFVADVGQLVGVLAKKQVFNGGAPKWLKLNLKFA